MNNSQQINQDSGDYEYYTPSEIVEAAREVMGVIHLDPASSLLANQTVKADNFYAGLLHVEKVGGWDLPALTSLSGGLERTWHGNIWMNHPFSRGEAPCKTVCVKEICQKRGYHTAIRIPGNRQWIAYLAQQYKIGNIEQSCNITYVNTSETWFRPLLEHLQCFIYGRTNYYRPDGTKKKGVTKGSVVTYIGPNVDRFREVFSEFGAVK
ncbi:MAG: hypothetical protein ABUJ92_00260 [Desulfobacterales bacterium]